MIAHGYGGMAFFKTRVMVVQLHEYTLFLSCSMVHDAS